LDFKEKPKTNNLGPLLQDALDASGLTGAKVDLGLRSRTRSSSAAITT
jgi:hypothetical protein